MGTDIAELEALEEPSLTNFFRSHAGVSYGYFALGCRAAVVPVPSLPAAVQ